MKLIDLLSTIPDEGEKGMKYHTIYADPPWSEYGVVDEGLMSIIHL